MTAQDDLRLRSRIRDLLDSCPAVDPFAVHLDVNDGLVRLHGTVGSYAEKLAAAELAAAVAGSERVRNDLEPRAYGRDWHIADEDIAAGIRRQLETVFVPSGPIDVEVDHHVVTLRGRLPTAAERAMVRHVVETVSGVDFIHNEIAV